MPSSKIDVKAPNKPSYDIAFEILNYEGQFNVTCMLYDVLRAKPGRLKAGEHVHAATGNSLNLQTNLIPLISQNRKEIQPSMYRLQDKTGYLHLFSVGLCYFEFKEMMVYPNASLPNLHAELESMMAYRRKLINLPKPFTSPVLIDLLHMQEEVSLFMKQALTPKESKHIASRIKDRVEFYKTYINKLSLASTQVRYSTNALSKPEKAKLINNFMSSTPEVYAYFPEVVYPYQNKRIVFSSPLVRRMRKNHQEVIDVLSRNRLYGEAYAGIYKVRAVYADTQKRKPRHKRLYKLNQGDRFWLEYEATQTKGKALRARNYHPGLFEMRHLGINLRAYFKLQFNELYDDLKIKNQPAPFYTESMRLLLEVSYKAFEALSKLGDEYYHGDIKAENIVISESRKVNIIDFAVGYYTPRFASPETLAVNMEEVEEDVLSPKSDVYSLARSLVRLYGDTHEVFDAKGYEYELVREIKAVITSLSPELLLSSFKARLNLFVQSKALTQYMANFILGTFVQCHHVDSQKRPLAGEAAENFKQLYEIYNRIFPAVDYPLKSINAHRNHK